MVQQIQYDYNNRHCLFYSLYNKQTNYFYCINVLAKIASAISGLLGYIQLSIKCIIYPTIVQH